MARRYSHFRSNHNALVGMFSGHRLPRLPPKQLLPAAASAAATASLVAERLVMLDAYLKQMLAVPDVYVGGCTQMLTFLGAYQGMQTSWFAQPNWRAGSIDGGGDDDEGGAAAAADSTWELAALHGGGEAAARQAPASASLLLQAQVLVDGLGLQVRSASYPVRRTQCVASSVGLGVQARAWHARIPCMLDHWVAAGGHRLVRGQLQPARLR